MACRFRGNCLNCSIWIRYPHKKQLKDSIRSSTMAHKKDKVPVETVAIPTLSVVESRNSAENPSSLETSLPVNVEPNGIPARMWAWGKITRSSPLLMEKSFSTKMVVASMWLSTNKSSSRCFQTNKRRVGSPARLFSCLVPS